MPFDPAQLTAVRVSQAEFARICRVSRQAVSEWVRKGKISVFPDGKIDPHADARQVFERTDPARLRARVFRGAVVSIDRLRQRVGELESQLAAERDCRERLTIHKDDLARMDVALVATLVERFDDLVSANQLGELQAAIEQITSWCLWRASAENEEEESAEDRTPGLFDQDSDRPGENGAANAHSKPPVVINEQ